MTYKKKICRIRKKNMSYKKIICRLIFKKNYMTLEKNYMLFKLF